MGCAYKVKRIIMMRKGGERMKEIDIRALLEKIKSLEGITESEWEKIKSVVDESFERERRERVVRLSLKTTETVLKTNLFA